MKGEYKFGRDRSPFRVKHLYEGWSTLNEGWNTLSRVNDNEIENKDEWNQGEWRVKHPFKGEWISSTNI